MPGQTWVASNQGQYLFSPKLSQELTMQLQPKLRFAQFAEIKEEWGKRSGETFLFDSYGDIDTQGGVLTETATIPMHKYILYQGTGTMKELGNSIPFTRKYEDLSQVTVRNATTKVLSNDAARVIDTSIEAQFDRTKIRYVATTTAAANVCTNGTATGTCTSILNVYHVKTIVDYMFQTMKVDPYVGEDWMCIASTNAKRGVYDDVEPILQYTKYPASGEFGKYYDTRFVKTNHGLSNAMGASSAYGEAYFFGGSDPVMRGIAQAVEMIPKEETDYRRSRGLAWYAVEAHALRFCGDPDSNVVKFDSL